MSLTAKREQAEHLTLSDTDIDRSRWATGVLLPISFRKRKRKRMKAKRHMKMAS
jgi:hypothetical protein